MFLALCRRRGAHWPRALFGNVVGPLLRNSSLIEFDLTKHLWTARMLGRVSAPLRETTTAVTAIVCCTGDVQLRVLMLESIL